MTPNFPFCIYFPLHLWPNDLGSTGAELLSCLFIVGTLCTNCGFVPFSVAQHFSVHCVTQVAAVSRSSAPVGGVSATLPPVARYLTVVSTLPSILGSDGPLLPVDVAAVLLFFADGGGQSDCRHALAFIIGHSECVKC